MADAILMRNISWVEPYLESPWVKAMGLFAPSFPPPDADHSSQAFRHFVLACTGGAAVLALTSAVAASCVLLRSCWCCSCGRKRSSQPSVTPLICMGFLTLLLTFASMFTHLLVGHKGVSLTVDFVSRAASDVSRAAEQGEALGALGRQASVTLNSTIPKCEESLQFYLRQVQQPLESYRELVDQYNADMAGIPERLSSLHSTLDNVSDLGMYSLMAPLALVLLCCFAIVLAACTARSARGSGRCSKCCVHSLGLVLFAPAILVVGAATAAEFGFGLATASFCRDADTNALTYIQHYADGLTYNVSRYYISGAGTNPLLDQLREANGTISELESVVDQLGYIVATQCTDAGPAVENISAILKSVHAPLNNVDDLLRPANLYPLYKTAIHEDACATMVSGDFWLVLLQFVVGVVCLPKLTCMANRFLDQWVEYRASPAAHGLIGQADTQMSHELV